MNIFVLQVYTGEEEKFINFAQNRLSSPDISFYFPKRELLIRKNKKDIRSFQPLFPGYVFMECENINNRTISSLCQIPIFCRFLQDNFHIISLPEDEKRTIYNLIKYGTTIKKSIVIFDENDKIKVLEGPLQGVEGQIVKVDKRKHRAKVRLNLYENSFLIDFGFECLNKI